MHSKPKETVSKYFKYVNTRIFLGDTHWFWQENHLTIEVFPLIFFQNHLPKQSFLSESVYFLTQLKYHLHLKLTEFLENMHKISYYWYLFITNKKEVKKN